MFQIIEKNGHKGIFIGEVDDKPVVVTLKDAPKKMDWFEAKEYAKRKGLGLPNQRELMLMYIHKEKLNKALKEVGGEPLADDWYWSSSEYSGSNAWAVNPSDGSNKYGNYFRVRCVLAF